MNIVKYPGGKERELEIINKFMPSIVKNYYEPFIGGGTVYLTMTANHYYVNDISSDLINLYQCIAKQDAEFFASMEEINRLWKSIDTYCEENNTLVNLFIKYRNHEITDTKLENKIDLYIKNNNKILLSFVEPMNCGNTDVFLDFFKKDIFKKFNRIKELHYNEQEITDEDIKDNITGIFKASFYMYIRSLYDHMGHYTEGFKAMLYLFIRDFCYSSMFRFNTDGGFNVPYGGISYNRKNYDKTFEKYKNQELVRQMENTTICCEDYRTFLEKYPPRSNDFMFIDPPCDTFLSTYNQKTFGADEQKILADYLLNKCPCNFMADIKYTDFIGSLYPANYVCANGQPLRIVFFDKNNSASLTNQNKKQIKHILIMNYDDIVGTNLFE